MNTIDPKKNYYEIKNQYLANGLSFLGFRFFKLGYGKDTIYSFEETEQFKKAFKKLLDLKEDISRDKQ